MTDLVIFRIQLPYGHWYSKKDRELIESMIPDTDIWEEEQTEKDEDKYILGMRRIKYMFIDSILADTSKLAHLSRICRPTILGSITMSRNIANFEQRVDSVVNERVQVVVPGPALLEYDEVLLMSDACTDALQENLDHGWRILAIAVQPNQRRPDYILGRVREK